MTEPFEHTSRKIGEAVRQVEEDLQSFVRYFNNEVVPKVRTEGTQALRTAADQLRKLADKMERGGGGTR